jgi:hypothetical protein
MALLARSLDIRKGSNHPFVRGGFIRRLIISRVTDVAEITEGM